MGGGAKTDFIPGRWKP